MEVGFDKLAILEFVPHKLTAIKIQEHFGNEGLFGGITAIVSYEPSSNPKCRMSHG